MSLVRQTPSSGHLNSKNPITLRFDQSFSRTGAHDDESRVSSAHQEQSLSICVNNTGKEKTVYLVTKQPDRYQQTVLWDVLLDDLTDVSAPRRAPYNPSNTHTYHIADDWRYISKGIRIIRDINASLQSFNERWADLIDTDLSKHYHTYKIPKHSGGLREINEPDTRLMTAQYELKALLEGECGLLYHTSAYAYVKGRCTVDAVRKHQANESNWFLKTDFKDFFGSTTPEFVIRMFCKVWPFNGLERICGNEELRKALSICFLHGGLPQGSPISPLITNGMMIPIDHALFNTLRSFYIEGREYHMVYTRYADDMMISCRVGFKQQAVIDLINQVLERFSAPFRLHPDKTKYTGRSWMLGVRITQENKISVGSKSRRRLEAMICNFIADYKRGIHWSLGDLQHVMGLVSYYKMVEPENIDKIISNMDEKFCVDSMSLLKKEAASV